mmetsp:Transcript_41081/g.103530  ORF Transcript_41081/g.103530 Transcript_41081/m.103530 type:complete len:244 (-) Transcript_41081:134-865(-)|eukprot:CAMPEP_0177631602 /NCGR_PEP_ID=MMETSP0447-20121125/1838_1 /TAXON_ID=0 /ORGANISM="Stygamoeba regulata, Strain BSH-02190019" /LENGTH=243 /DNA_ID=CAMNT_0019133099 /DNA_START=39 /DNA_END=770 /DNA_ORIENTATION=+
MAANDREAKIATEEDFANFESECKGTDEWKEAYTDKARNIVIWTKKTKLSPINMMRLRTEFPDIEPELLYDVLHDHIYRKAWDDSMVAGYIVQQLDPTNEVGYYSAKSPGPVANRDFCNQRTWRGRPDEGKWMIFNHSVKHPDCGEVKGFVRAISVFSGYLVERREGGGTVFTYITCTDPCGWIPSFVVNSLMTSFAPKVIDKLISASASYADWKKDHYPDWKPWLDEENVMTWPEGYEEPRP